MPNIDGGHYFLTALAPIRVDPVQGPAGNLISPTASLRALLATLPIGCQSVATDAGAKASPFSRCHRTHLARFAVIDQPSFNGRDAGNAIVQGARKTDLLIPQPVDVLACSWLLLAVDFDAGAQGDGGLHDYLSSLWTLMGEALGAVYSHCFGFEAVSDGDGFADYVSRCQVETTMPFNDYWMAPPALPSVSLVAVIGLTLASALAASGLLLYTVKLPFGWAAVAFPIALAIALFGAFRFINMRGLRPFPRAPGSDLPTILKSLYLQQRFVRFAEQAQGASDAALYTAFGDFLAQERPTEIALPTQAPGVVRS